MIFRIGCRQATDECRDGNDLVVLRPLRFLDQIDDFDPVFARQMDVAKFLEIGERGQRFGGLARDVKTQIVMAPGSAGFALRARFASGSFSLCFHK